MGRLDKLDKEYFNWMVDLVSTKDQYTKLLRLLHNTDYEYQIDRDGNRYENGIDLRYRFGYEYGYSNVKISQIDNRPCSVLEMMVALSLKCEEEIMADPEFGSRIGDWFWGMIDNLGLSDQTDDRFDQHIVVDILRRFMENRYERNGRGGLFTIRRKDVDMRKEEIWYQANWFFDELIFNKRRKLL